MKNITLYELPMLKERPSLSERLSSMGYQVATYVFATPDAAPSIPLLTRMNLLRKVIATDGKPFYAADVFGTSYSLGGWICGLSLSGIIEETGNTRECLIPLGNDLFKQVSVKEWRLSRSAEEMWSIYEEIKLFITDHL